MTADLDHAIVLAERRLRRDIQAGRPIKLFAIAERLDLPYEEAYEEVIKLLARVAIDLRVDGIELKVVGNE